MNYESLILEIAPDLRELLQTIQTINNGHFNRGRTGWIIRQVENPESDYRHSLKVGLAAFYLLGTRHALDMGLSHDFPEIIAPDRTPGEIPPEERKKEELEAMQELKQVLPNGDYWFNLWQDFENGVGIGPIVRELDKICPSVQALDYIRDSNGSEIRLREFYPSSRRKIKTPELITTLDDLHFTGIPQGASAYSVYFEALKRISLS